MRADQQHENQIDDVTRQPPTVRIAIIADVLSGPGAPRPGVLTGRIGLSPAMIGRNDALQRLRSLIAQAVAPSSDLPTIALVAGEAGIGKTRLVREALAELAAAAGDRVVVIAGSAEPGSLARAYDLVAQLAPIGSSQPTLDVLDMIVANANPIVGDACVIVVVVEDLHWVDVESAAFIDDLARRPLAHVVIVGTYRPSDLRRGAPGGDLVSRLERRNEVEQIRLERLSRHEVGAMMSSISGAPVSSAAVEAVIRRSAGVPFVVEELMRCISPDSCRGEVFDVPLPWSLDEAVRQQLAGLGAVERTIVDTLAVVAEPTSYEVLASVSALDDADLLRGLRELIARGVVVEPREDRLWFEHALVADSVLHELLGRERRRLHQRCYDVLQQITPDDHSGLVRHALGASRYDEVVDIARRGAREYLDRGQSFQALRLACEGLAENSDECELLAVATEAAWRLDFQQEAIDHARRWLELAVIQRDRVDAQRYVARLLFELGDRDGADAVVQQLVAAAARYGADGLVAEQARAEAAVAQLMMLRQDPDAVEWAKRAILHAQISGDRFVEVQAEVEWASALQSNCSRHESIAALHAVAAKARTIGDGVSLARSINNMMDLLCPIDASTVDLRRELRDIAVAVGLDKLGGLNNVWWASVAAEASGDLAEFRRLVELWASWNPDAHTSSGKYGELVRIAIEEGRLADARTAMPVVPESVCDVSGVNPLLLRIALAGVERDAQAAGLAWRQLSRCSLLPDGWAVSSLVVDAVASALAAGLPPTEVRQLLDSTLLSGHPSASVFEPIVRGLIALAEHRHDDAVVAFRRSLLTARADVRRPVQGLIEISLAQALLAAGDRPAARRAADDALISLARWPGWRRDRAEALATRLESSSLRTAGDLTTRESEVAVLVAEGLSNGQLAERLFISPKTAAVHVSNILAKLGLSTRAEIAAWEVRRHLPAVG